MKKIILVGGELQMEKDVNLVLYVENVRISYLRLVNILLEFNTLNLNYILSIRFIH